MKSITIYPKNEKQRSLLTSLLEEMKVRFDIQESEENLSLEQKQGIDEALVSLENGEGQSHDSVMKETKEKYAKYFQ
jgi:uncharacterized protein YlxP (DUF503 family)